MSPNVIAKDPFADVPISILCNDALRTYLELDLKDPFVNHSDCLDESFSLSGVSGGEDLDGIDDYFNEMFNLKVCHLVKNVLAIGGGKRRRRKHKMK
ncbi:hypothetical protein MA16_Dca028732 [Dendrobium catenatum]|uniref:Uncharacterized protein n=1 Tax=Dendrobium catenatum TaxID=906689 RepID=A0A2I0VGL3_9ASPA|nr:hypothetical protein MA16_Dca028732 [Dendrobium catenatum]